MTTKPEGAAQERILQAIATLEFRRMNAEGDLSSTATTDTAAQAEMRGRIEIIDRDIGLLKRCLDGTLSPEPPMADRKALTEVESEIASRKVRADSLREGLSDAARIKELLRTGG